MDLKKEFLLIFYPIIRVISYCLVPKIYILHCILIYLLTPAVFFKFDSENGKKQNNLKFFNFNKAFPEKNFY